MKYDTTTGQPLDPDGPEESPPDHAPPVSPETGQPSQPPKPATTSLNMTRPDPNSPPTQFRKPATTRVVVTDVEIPFRRMVAIVLKFSVALLIVGFLLAIPVMLLVSLFLEPFARIFF